MAGTSGTSSSYARHREMFRLPVSRIRTIMKSSPDVENIQQQASFLVTKATELFIQFLAKEGLERSLDKSEVDYQGLAEFVQTSDNLAFLREIMPKKIKYGEYKAMKAREEKKKSGTELVTISDQSDESSDVGESSTQK